MSTDHNADAPRRHDIKFIRQDDGTDAAVITFPPGTDYLGVDAPLLIDYFDTVIIALHSLRAGEYDAPGPETVRRLYNSIMHVDQKLLPRLNGLRNALIRAHYAAGGSHRDLSLAMDTSRETAISRGNKIRNSEPDQWERWARRELPADTARGVNFTAPDRLFHVGDPVRLRTGRRFTWTDEDLETEGEDARVSVELAAGTQGRVTMVRSYQTPFPYVVLFDGDQEVSVREEDIERSGFRWADRVRPRQEAAPQGSDLSDLLPEVDQSPAACAARTPHKCYQVACPNCSQARCPSCRQWLRAPKGHDPLKHHMDYCEEGPNP